MYPFEPASHHHIIGSTSTNSHVGSNNERNFWSVWTESNPIKTRGSEIVGCYASVLIPKDTKSKTICALDTFSGNVELRKINLMTREGYLHSNEKVPDNVWIKNLKYSMDTHSNNVILELSNDEIQLRAIRNINAGEEILLWFSEEILACMYIPFLTPANIRGKNSYTCHTCEKSFENPNPLKIHIATNCERIADHYLWVRLEKYRHRNLLTKSPCTVMHYHQRLSAFQPVRTKLQYNSIDGSATCSTSSATASVYDVLPTALNVDSEQAITAAAHLETIVSNMGTSKQGHLCIYCGKLYSRKYGLKIHIRTHTGFKPLKCKYCYRPFGDPSNLNKHVRLHVQGNTVYKCTDCGKVLVRRRDLQRHIQARHRKCDGNGDDRKSESAVFERNTFDGRTTGTGISSSGSDNDDQSINEMIEVE